MLDHHIQRSIVYKLALAPSLRFSELKPDDIESKLFTYHLKKVTSAGLAEKRTDGSYALTPEGRLVGVHVMDNQRGFVDQAYSVLFLAVRRAEDGAWLLYKRRTHPLIGRVGFMHATPNAQEESAETAANELKQLTGLTGTFSVLGGGYFRVFEADKLESFTHFTLLSCSDASGELIANDAHAEYFWETEPDFSDPSMLPNMAILAEKSLHTQPFHLEETLRA